MSKAGMHGNTEMERLEKEWKSGTLKPKYVQWLCTHKCNFRCAHCGTSASEARTDELRKDEIIPVMDKLAEMGTEIISFTGGEPILRPDLWEIIAHIKDLGMKPGFVTNGYAVNKFAKEIARAEVYSVVVSLDGYGENHNKIRGMPDSYQKAIGALDIFKDAGVPVIGCATVYMRDNVDDLGKIHEDAMNHGAIRHRVQTVVEEGRAKGKGNPPDIIENVFRFVLDERRRGGKIEVGEGHGFLGKLDGYLRPRFFCYAGWGTFTIMSNGNIMGCPAFDYPELNEGSIRRKGVDEIWRDGFGRFRETYMSDLPGKCKECKYLEACRGGCWMHRVNGDFCYVDIADKVAEEML